MDKTHPLCNVDWGTSGTTIYRGHLVSYNVPVYDIMGQKVFRPSEVDAVIDSACKGIDESITVSAGSGSNVAVNSLDTENNHDLGTGGTHVWEI